MPLLYSASKAYGRVSFLRVRKSLYEALGDAANLVRPDVIGGFFKEADVIDLSTKIKSGRYEIDEFGMLVCETKDDATSVALRARKFVADPEDAVEKFDDYDDPFNQLANSSVRDVALASLFDAVCTEEMKDREELEHERTIVPTLGPTEDIVALTSAAGVGTSGTSSFPVLLVGVAINGLLPKAS